MKLGWKSNPLPILYGKKNNFYVSLLTINKPSTYDMTSSGFVTINPALTVLGAKKANLFSNPRGCITLLYKNLK